MEVTSRTNTQGRVVQSWVKIIPSKYKTWVQKWELTKQILLNYRCPKFDGQTLALIDLETTGRRVHNDSWPVILTSQVHGFKINNWTNKFIHIDSVNYKNS